MKLKSKLKFPYGYCDFEKIIRKNYLFVDRTDRIHLLEEIGDNILFLRPRRFGKSLLLSMLENYYDLAKADRFEELFGQLAIGQNPTPNHNQYFVMKWDFSMVDPRGEVNKIERSLFNHINQQIRLFSRHYEKFLSYPIDIIETDGFASFQAVLAAIHNSPHRLYLLIDEYDNFANEVMVSREQGQQRYERLIQGEGILKMIFKIIKGTLAGMGLERVFITGVSPVVMSDLTSGQHVAENIYFQPEFNDLCGFRENEVVEMLEQIAVYCRLSHEKTDQTMNMMRRFYDGYTFTNQTVYRPDAPSKPDDSNQAERIYNPTMIFYFLKYLQRYCEYPEEMLDINLAPDRRKLEYVALLPGGPEIILKALDEHEPLTVPKITGRFGVREMLETEDDDTFVASLLYYLGMLTFGGKQGLRRLILRVPNLTIRGLYFERLQKILLPKFNKNEAERVAEIFYTTGNLQPTCEFIEQRFTVFDNRDYKYADELLIKTAFVTVLYNGLYYTVDSETTLQRGYADLTMIIRPDMRPYPLLDHVIEFKYLKLKETGLSGAEVRALSEEKLRALPKVQAKLNDADSQLSRYRQGLHEIYGDKLRLKSHTVVSVGFERVVWEMKSEE
ncbi:AAA family ATPase [Anaerolineales bacterium HSG24]|nr:AAA family ATPase [Anaerolineales bacterium HSG24]